MTQPQVKISESSTLDDIYISLLAFRAKTSLMLQLLCLMQPCRRSVICVVHRVADSHRVSRYVVRRTQPTSLAHFHSLMSSPQTTAAVYIFTYLLSYHKH